MEKAISYVAWPLIAPFHFAQSAQRSRAEATTNQYLENVSEISLLAGLSDFLAPLLHDNDRVEQIFDKFAARSDGGVPVWDESSFKIFVTAMNGDANASVASVSLLWRLFSSTASFPFDTTRLQSQSKKNATELGRDGFMRAFALLVLGGFTLLGYKRDLQADFVQHKNQVSRNARFILSCSSHPYEMTPEDHGEEIATENILDVVYLAQPPTYEGKLSATRSADSSFECAAQRIVSGIRERPNCYSISPRISKEDLRSLLQLVMLVSLGDHTWKHGVIFSKGFGMLAAMSEYTSDSVLFATLVYSLSQVALAQALAHGIVERYF